MKHIASHAIVGVTGHRVGTHYIFKPENIEPARFKPHFRFRNTDCEVEYAKWKAQTRVQSEDASRKKGK